MTKVNLPDEKVTLERCSENDNGEAVTHLQNMVYCFDDISQDEGDKYRKKKKMYSADGIHINDKGELFFFEFKNTPHSHMPWPVVMRKMHDSILTWQVCQASNESLDDLMKKSTFFVIYNDSHYEGERENPSVSIEKMKERMKCLAKQSDEPLLGGLGLYLNSFYKEIHTIDVDTFEHGYVNKIFKNINMEG